MSDKPEFEPAPATEPAAMKPLWGYAWAVINFALGVMILLHVAGWIQLETRAGNVFLFVLGITLLLLAAYLVFVARANAARGDRPQTDAERKQYARASTFIGTLVFAFLAFAMTTIAYYAWLPEQAAAFSGGITGSLWETRFIWGATALLLDSICVFGLWRALRRNRRQE